MEVWNLFDLHLLIRLIKFTECLLLYLLSVNKELKISHKLIIVEEVRTSLKYLCLDIYFDIEKTELPRF